MAEALVSDWISDYDAITPSEERTFAAQHQHNHDVAAAIFAIFEESYKYTKLIDQICHQLFGFYRSKQLELQYFAIQFFPSLIYLYLNSVAHGDKKNCRCVETFLLGVYNLEVVDENEQPKVISFRMPFLAQSSLYHEAKGLAQSDLRRWEECCTKLVNWGPLPQMESLNAQNRLKVMTALMFVYNRHLVMVQKPALHYLCKATSKLVTQGFPKQGCPGQRTSYVEPRPPPRIPMAAQFLLELVHAAYFAMFNEFASVATLAVEDIHNRASFELYPEVILVTNAIKHSLSDNPSGQPCDGPMGISVALSPATTTVTVSKSMITNASFRTKKLPDDIPIQAPKDESNDAGNKSLVVISEESEQDPLNSGDNKQIQRGSSIRLSKDGGSLQSSGGKGLPKLQAFSGLSKKLKDSTKHQIKNGTESKADARRVSKENKSTSRASLQISANGDCSEDASSSPLPLLRKKSSSVDTPSGPVSLENPINGLQGMQFSESEKVSLVSDSLQISTDMSDVTADSLDSTGGSFDNQNQEQIQGTDMGLRLLSIIDGKNNTMQVSQV